MKGTGAEVESLRSGMPDGISKGDVCILVAPNGRTDYKVAQSLAESKTAKAVVIVNGLAKVSRTISLRYHRLSTSCSNHARIPTILPNIIRTWKVFPVKPPWHIF
jgi:hypothetical protein